jgi:phosphoribosylformylglycinamidine synthase
VAIAESAFSSYRHQAVGCEVNLEGDVSAAALLYAETPSRILLSAREGSAGDIQKIAKEHAVAAAVLGRTAGDRLVIKVNDELVIDRAVSEVEEVWRGVLPQALETASLIAAEESHTG